MVCMEHFQHFKRKTLVRLESATPAVDHPVAKVELRQVREKMLCLSLRSTWSTAATLPLLLIQYNNKRIYNKRGKYTVSYSIYKGNGELSSRGLNISPQTMNMKYIQYIQCVAA
jgi:hypothetical protein